MNETRVEIIGVPISAVNMDSCLANIFENWERAKGNYICVSNVHTTVMAHDNPSYHAVQRDSFLSIPDGKPLCLLGRRKNPAMGHVRGVDLMRRLFEESRTREIRHFFYGSTQSTLDALLAKLTARYPWLKIVGSEPSLFREMTPEEETRLESKICQSSADILWVALGAPKQEFFCSQLRGKTQALAIGVGGAFNVLAGIVPDAPRWIRLCGLEWLFRLTKEPKRLFHRYISTNSRFVYYLLIKPAK